MYGVHCIRHVGKKRGKNPRAPCRQSRDTNRWQLGNRTEREGRRAKMAQIGLPRNECYCEVFSQSLSLLSKQNLFMDNNDLRRFPGSTLVELRSGSGSVSRSRLLIAKICQIYRRYKFIIAVIYKKNCSIFILRIS